jgi:8-oxo-dGTP pyrophosphatase MutT (NUDIX family)
MKRQQYGALPCRRAPDGSLQIALITSRDSGRWVIPKGWPISNLSPWESAAREALEEGGFVGEIAQESIGEYEYLKQTSDAAVVCVVEVFPLVVRRQMANFEEKGQRRIGWFSPSDAAESVAEQELSALIMRFGSSR